MFYLYVNKYEE